MTIGHQMETNTWAAKFFATRNGNSVMPILEMIEVLSTADGVPKDVREIASEWKKTGKRPGASASKDSASHWIEAAYGTYEMMCKQHEASRRKLAELRDRSMSSFTTYIKSIQSSTLPGKFQNLAEQANKVLQQLNPATFADDILLMPLGAKSADAAALILEVWNDPAAAIEQTTGAARALRRHEFLMLYRDDNGAAGIETNASDESTLFRMFVEKYDEAKAGPLLPYLKPLIEIACSLRGYKSAVSHVTVLQAGAATFPNSRNVNGEE